jgi:hypothetical protein
MPEWWLEKPLRMIQTNLREIDASLDLETYIQSLKEFSAEVVLFNVGGIVANYPTELPYHYRNPHLQDDLVGKVIERTHKEGIRFLARFDFSKINEIYADNNPDWLYKNIKGEFVNYNGQVHTCICGGYQQDYALKILDEACARYPLDGVFFNMIGFVTYDYDHHYHGICQCQGCQEGFQKMFSVSLPQTENPADPVFRNYELFKRRTVRDLFQRIRTTVKNRRPEAAVLTYTQEGTDLFRHESNSGIERIQPEWIYSATENVKTILNSWSHLQVVNAAVHFVDFQFRHAAVSPHLTSRRLAQNLACGGWLDYYVIGHLNNQDDRECFKGVKEIYAFHKKQEQRYAGLKSIADVAILYPVEKARPSSLAEFRGILQILAEEHILFDILHDSLFDNGLQERLPSYQVIILPDLGLLSQADHQALDHYVNGGGKILATGRSAFTSLGASDPLQPSLQSAGIDRARQVIAFRKGMYLRIRPQDKVDLHGLDNLDIIYLNDELIECQPRQTAKTCLRYIPPHMFGPPEKCYYLDETNIPGIIANSFGKGRCLTIPWRIGAHYHAFSTHAHPILLQSALTDLLTLKKSLETNAPPLVEIHLHRQVTTGDMLLNLVNLSGQSFRATHAPVEIGDIEISIRCPQPPARIISLQTGDNLVFETTAQNFIRFILPGLSLFESILIQG